MSTTAVIGLGIVVWVLVSVPAALVVARMIRLRDQRLVDFGSDDAIQVRRELLGDGVAALALGLDDPPDVIAGQVGGPADRGLCCPEVRADDAALDAIATVRAEQRCEALLLYLILTEKTKR